MKTTVPLINERVVSRIARNLYHMTFMEEYVMHQRNKGKVTWWPALVAILATVVLAILPFKVHGQNQMPAIMFAIVLGPVFCYSAIKLCAQERMRNRQWGEICSIVNKFKHTLKCEESHDWDSLVANVQKRLGELALEHLSAEIDLQERKDNLAYWIKGNEDPAVVGKMTPTELVKRGLVVRKSKENLARGQQHVMETKELFELSFSTAKNILGDYVDNGHGFGVFLKREEEKVKAEVLA